MTTNIKLGLAAAAVVGLYWWTRKRPKPGRRGSSVCASPYVAVEVDTPRERCIDIRTKQPVDKLKCFGVGVEDVCR